MKIKCNLVGVDIFNFDEDGKLGLLLKVKTRITEEELEGLKAFIEGSPFYVELSK